MNWYAIGIADGQVDRILDHRYKKPDPDLLFSAYLLILFFDYSSGIGEPPPEGAAQDRAKVDYDHGYAAGFRPETHQN